MFILNIYASIKILSQYSVNCFQNTLSKYCYVVISLYLGCNWKLILVAHRKDKQYFQVPQPICWMTSTNGNSVCECVCGSVIIWSCVIGQTVQKLVSHWLRMAAMFRSRVKFWGVGGKMLFTVHVCTNWFRQKKLVWAGIKTIYWQ